MTGCFTAPWNSSVATSSNCTLPGGRIFSCVATSLPLEGGREKGGREEGGREKGGREGGREKGGREGGRREGGREGEGREGEGREGEGNDELIMRVCI